MFEAGEGTTRQWMRHAANWRDRGVAGHGRTTGMLRQGLLRLWAGTKSQEGFILPFAIMVVLAGIFIVIPVLVMAGSNFRGHARIEDQLRDYYAADANVHAIIEDLKRGADLVPIPPNTYTPPSIDFGEVVPSVSIQVFESELLSTVKPVEYLPSGNPTVLVGFSPSGSGLDLAYDDGTYYQLTDAGTPPDLAWEITSQEIGFPSVSYGSIQVVAQSTKGYTALELYVYNPDDPLHTNGGYNTLPDVTEILDLASVDETISVFLSDEDVSYLNTLTTKTVKVKVRATRTGGFKLFTDKLAFSMAGVVTSDERRADDEPLITVGTLSSGSATDLDHDDSSYYKVNSATSGTSNVVEYEITTEAFMFSGLDTLQVSFVGRTNKSGVTLEIFVYNTTDHGAGGYDTVADLSTTIPINNTDKAVGLSVSESDIAYFNTLFPLTAKLKIRASHTTGFQLESDMLVLTATSAGTTGGASVVPQTIQQYLDPGLHDPYLANVAGKQGYLLRIWNVKPGLMNVNWAYHTADYTQAKATVMIFRGLVANNDSVVPPGRITSKPPSQDNELLVSATSRSQESFAHSGFLDVDKGLYTVVFFNDSASTIITDAYSATGKTEDTWVYVGTFKDYIIDVSVENVGLRAVVRQVPGPIEPPAAPWSGTNISWVRNLVYIQSWEPYGIDLDALPPPPPATPLPETVATDDWESGGFAGGTGWLAGWTAQGGLNAAVTTQDTPYAGTFHLRLQSGDGYVSRSLDLSAYTDVRLQFRARVFSLEATDAASLLVSPDGINWTTVYTFTATDSDNIYTLWDFDLSAFSMTSQFYIAFDANMNATGDQLFIDNITVIGTPQ